MDEQIITLYQEGQSLAALSREFGLSTYKIRQFLVNNNIHIRSKAEQAVFTNQQRTKSVDINYFDNIDTPKKAWILGFLAADGTVDENRNRIKIGLSTVDREILEKIKTEIKIERKILDTETNNGFSVSELVWSNCNHKIQLAKYGIIPKKTYKEMKVPDFTSDLQLAFIQGFFDGDGCFKDDGQYCRWEVCAYRPEILQSIEQVIHKNFGFSKQVYKDKSRDNYYTLTYSTEEAWSILKRCYEICPLYLNRKMQKVILWAKRNQRI